MIGEDFVCGHPCCLILGDNVLYGHGLPDLMRRAANDSGGATIFAYLVDEPQRYGVIEFDEQFDVISIVEKPKIPKSNWAAIGLYFYDKDVIDLVKTLKPSARGEYEITDLNNLYIREKKLKVERIGRGFAWFDAGTFDSLLEAAEFVRVLQSRQGQLISAPEEIAYLSGWISGDDLKMLASKLDKSYGRLLTEGISRRVEFADACNTESH
jgi:glucose-1-phosphate thymidylyltransferase